jgi:hypothetical protein
MEASAEKIVELIIRMDDKNLNARGLGAYLSLADRVYGRMTELGLKSYSQAIGGQLSIQEIRKGSLEIVMAQPVTRPKDATPLAVLWLCLKHLPSWIRAVHEADKSWSEPSGNLTFNYGSLYGSLQEERVARESRRRLRGEIKRDGSLERLDDRKVSQLAVLLEELYMVERRQLPAAARFAAKSVKDVILLVRAPSSLPVNRYPLRGTPIHYEDPTLPVAQDDWEAAR